MNDITLDDLERRMAEEEAEYRAEQAKRFAMAMKAVDEVAPHMGYINHVSVLRTWRK